MGVLIKCQILRSAHLVTQSILCTLTPPVRTARILSTQHGEWNGARRERRRQPAHGRGTGSCRSSAVRGFGHRLSAEFDDFRSSKSSGKESPAIPFIATHKITMLWCLMRVSQERNVNVGVRGISHSPSQARTWRTSPVLPCRTFTPHTVASSCSSHVGSQSSEGSNKSIEFPVVNYDRGAEPNHFKVELEVLVIASTREPQNPRQAPCGLRSASPPSSSS